MCQFRWIFTAAAIGGLIQSVVWMGLGLAGALVYLCVIPIEPYVTHDDFFRVTLVKLYFEGPGCIPNGGYLGSFESKYKSAITYLTHDRVFALMTVYVVINAVYFLLSITMYKDRKGVGRGLALSWSSMTLLLCVMDAFCVFGFISDHFSMLDAIRKHTGTGVSDLSEMMNIFPLLALLSGRFAIGWLWNAFLGCSIFMDALCCRKMIKRHGKAEKETKQSEKVMEVEEPRVPEFVPPPVSVVNGNFRSYFDISAHPDYLDYKKSMEEVTRFNTSDKSVKEGSSRNWVYAPTEASWHPKSHSSRDWEMTNEGYVSEEEERNVDFDHNLKNFEPGQRKIKIVKPPQGKPVSIPVPPPLPPSKVCEK